MNDDNIAVNTDKKTSVRSYVPVISWLLSGYLKSSKSQSIQFPTSDIYL
jgi:hypothetical protein